ncbi:MAG TPA: hypothetical protein DCS93_11275 [Microscillaceae bacterium]|nr:hypothetical protein [Microscillaceae bacterium]
MIEKPSAEVLDKLVSDLLKTMPALQDKLLPLSDDPQITPQVLMKEVLKFLYLVASTSKSLSPSLLTDLAWHEFILCTRLYMKFCQENFDRYIHHTPGGEKKETHRKYLQTIRLYIVIFGEPKKEIWGEMAHNEWLDAQCGTCNAN